MEYADLTALELSRRVREREVTLAEVAEEALAAARDDQHGAYTCLTEDLAAQQVETLQARLDDPDFEPGPLFGVPCPIKDLAQVEGVAHEAGSAAYRGNVATRTDGLVTRLQQAGTLTIGKTATPELGLPCYTEPEGRPPAVTPWDPTRMAGGSSGGAAAAVAAGTVPLAHGSDGGGSIRIPASCCGLVGLKASRGVVSKGPYGVDGPGLVSEGVLSRTVRDTAAALDALSRPWPGETFTAPPTNHLAAVEAPVRPLRIGVLTEPVIAADAPVHRGALNAVDRAARLLSELGHSLEEAPRPFPAEAWDAFGCVWAVGALSAPVPPEKEELLRPLTRWLRERGRHTTGVELAAALGGIQQLTRQTAEAWADFDVILSPTLAQPPLPVGALRNDDDPAKDFADQTAFTPWTSLYNLTGRPAISLPLHSEKVSGVELPFGVMLGADLFDDALLLSLGADLEDAAR